MAGAAGHEVSAAEAEALVRRFRGIFQRAVYLLGLEAIAIVGGGLVILIMGLASGPWAVAALLVYFVLIASLGILWYLNWRCPACGSYLGGGLRGLLDVNRCAACGARLI